VAIATLAQGVGHMRQYVEEAALLGVEHLLHPPRSAEAAFEFARAAAKRGCWDCPYCSQFRLVLDELGQFLKNYAGNC